MANSVTRRLTALEARASAAAGGNHKLLFVPKGLDQAAEDLWRAEYVAPLRAAGEMVMVVKFVLPARSADAVLN